jgi:hypothetical protein
MAENGDSSGGRYASMRPSRHKNIPHPAAFLSEIVQYWTAIYPELTHHQKVQSTLKQILPQERNR